MKDKKNLENICTWHLTAVRDKEDKPKEYQTLSQEQIEKCYKCDGYDKKCEYYLPMKYEMISLE